MIKNQCPICKREFCFCQCDHPVSLKAKTAFYIERAEMEKRDIKSALEHYADKSYYHAHEMYLKAINGNKPKR